MSINLDVTDPAIKAKLAVLPEKMLEWAFEVMLKQAELMRDLANIYAPVETGALRDSIRVERGGEGMHWRLVRVRAGGYMTNPKTGKRVDYAKHQEFGTKHMSAQPYMQPAFEEVYPTIAAMIQALVVEKASE